MKQPRWIVVVPPAALSMAGGPPVAAPILLHAFERIGAEVGLYDGNARFYRWFLSDSASSRVRAEIDRRLKQILGLPVLDNDKLSQLGDLLVARAGELDARTPLARRNGIDWAAVEEIMGGTAHDSESEQLRTALWNEVIELEALEILERRPDALAITVLLHEQVDGFVSLCARIRAKGFDGPVLVGGAFFKLAGDTKARELLRASGATLVWRSDLFEVPEDLADTLEARVDPASVRGGGTVTAGDHSGCMQRPFSPAPKALPGPIGWRGIDHDLYLWPKTYPVLVSIGCYWGRCDFCDYPYLASRTPGSPLVRMRSANTVARDLLELEQIRDVSRADLISDAIPYAWFGRLAQSLSEHGARGTLRLECSVRAERSATPAHFAAMSAAGIDSITLGVEALHDDVLTAMHKGNTVEDVFRCAQLAREHGIRVKANLIVDHPKLQAEHVAPSRKALATLAPMLDSLGVHRFSLSPYAPIAQELAQAGLAREPGCVTTNHGGHTLAFRCLVSDRERESAVAEFAVDAEALAYRLEVQAGRVQAKSRLLRLPYRWSHGEAVQDDDSSDLHVHVFGNDRPFAFFVGEDARDG